jgi:hypothetical protein
MFVIPFYDAGGGICSEGLIISKISRLGNGANVFAKTASVGPDGGLSLVQSLVSSKLWEQGRKCSLNANGSPRTIRDNLKLDL